MGDNMGKKVLIAGIGNILKGDDGLGPYVVKKLHEIGFDKDVDIVDFGSRIYDLFLRIGEYEKVIIVDAVDMGGEPGETYVLEPSIEAVKSSSINPHTLGLKMLGAILSQINEEPRKLFIVGCQPVDISYKIGLSDKVSKNIDQIIEIIKKLVGSHG